MIEFRVEPLTPELVEEMSSRQQDYWNETEARYRKFPLNVKWHILFKAQELGGMRLVTVRDDGLKGIGVVLITEDPFCDCILASVCLIYVLPEYRKGRVGIELASRLVDEARGAGAQLITGESCLHNKVYRLYEYLGFKDYARLLIREVTPCPQ